MSSFEAYLLVKFTSGRIIVIMTTTQEERQVGGKMDMDMYCIRHHCLSYCFFFFFIILHHLRQHHPSGSAA